MALLDLFKVPKPKSFLFFVPLRAAVEFIIFVVLINKISGLYGILALFTGYELSFLQLSHYIYNLLTLALVAWLGMSIRDVESPLKMIGLAWVYVLDTVINTIYTGFFIASWLIVLAQHLGHEPNLKVPGTGMIGDTAGFTSPEIDASAVEVDTKPSNGIMPGQDATAYASNDGQDQAGMLQSGGLMSIMIIITFLLFRVYFCLIILSYARTMVRQYIVMTSDSYSQSDDSTLAENPFREGREKGQGWSGMFGRLLLHFPARRYWLGRDDADEAWAKQTSERLSERKNLRVRIPETNEKKIEN